MDVAGDNLQTSKEVEFGTVSAKIDYANDSDVFYFIPSTTKTYNIKTLNNDENLDCYVYDRTGTQVTLDTSNGQVNISILLVKDRIYYFKISSYDGEITNYTFKIS